MKKDSITSALRNLVLVPWGFVKTWSKVLWGYKKNKAVVLSEDAAQKRLSICHGCENYNESMDLCQVCYCVMNVKARLIEAECPISKW